MQGSQVCAPPRRQPLPLCWRKLQCRGEKQSHLLLHHRLLPPLLAHLLHLLLLLLLSPGGSANRQLPVAQLERLLWGLHCCRLHCLAEWSCRCQAPPLLLLLLALGCPPLATAAAAA